MTIFTSIGTQLWVITVIIRLSSKICTQKRQCKKQQFYRVNIFCCKRDDSVVVVTWCGLEGRVFPCGNRNFSLSNSMQKQIIIYWKGFIFWIFSFHPLTLISNRCSIINDRIQFFLSTIESKKGEVIWEFRRFQINSCVICIAHWILLGWTNQWR